MCVEDGWKKEIERHTKDIFNVEIIKALKCSQTISPPPLPGLMEKLRYLINGLAFHQGVLLELSGECKWLVFICLLFWFWVLLEVS